jgi:hypothetical protein
MVEEETEERNSFLNYLKMWENSVQPVDYFL